MSRKRTIAREDFLDRVSPSGQLTHLQARVAELEGQLDRARESGGKFREAMDQVLRVVNAATPPAISYQPEKERAKPEVSMVVHATDWHIGARTMPQFIEEFGEFSWSRATHRVAAWQQKLVTKLAVARAGYTVNDCYILGTADWVSGDIHEELIRTNEFPCPEQAVKAGFLLGQFSRALAPHFRRVHVHALNAGNHDRITRKTQCEQGGMNSWGYVTTAIAEQYLKQCPTITFKSYPGSSALVEIPGMRYLMMHGDGIPAHMGVPHFGMDRLVMREALRRMNRQEVAFDAVVSGHWHVANNLLFCRYGGSLSGTTAHDHKYARHSAPHQTSWFVHSKHGEFDWTRWWL